MYWNLSIPSDWLSVFAIVASAKSSLYQEHNSFSHAKKSPIINKKKPVDKVTEPGFNLSNSHKNTNFCRSSHAHSRVCGEHKGQSDCRDYQRGRVSDNTPTNRKNNIKLSNPSDHSKDNCFKYNKM